jgi:acylaminoacyl-peptidase
MMRMRWGVVVILLLARSGANAGEKRPLAVDDLYRQESVSDFTVSPRGDEAVYVRSWYDVHSPGKRTALWRVDGETGEAAPLEPGEPDGRMPVYSPDGMWLAYVSNRSTEADRTNQRIPPYSDPAGYVWISGRDAGPKKAATSRRLLSWGAQAIGDSFYHRVAFSKNSQNLLAVTSGGIFRNHPAKISHGINVVGEDQGEGYEGYQPSAVSFWQKTNEQAESPFGTTWQNGIVDEFWYGDPQWSDDGSQVVCHANRTDDQESVRYSINKDYDLWSFAISSTGRHSEPTKLTSNAGPDVSPRISPDGKHVLYLSVPRKGPHMDVFNLCLLSLDQEHASPRVVINAHDAERAADGTPPFQPTFPLRDDSWIDDEHVRVRGVRGMNSETIVVNIRGADVAASAATKAEREPPANKKLVAPKTNAWRDERFEAREEIVKWKSLDGLEIEGVLTLPPAELTEFKAPYPVIVHPHGGPHSKSSPGFNFTVHVFAAKGYAVFQPNFRGSYGYGRKFLDAARFDMGDSDMQDITTGIDALIERGTVDKDRQFVYGVSYGGYSTCRLVTLSDRFRAAVAQNAVTDLHAMWTLSDLQSWTEWEFGGKPWETIEHEGRKIVVGDLMRERSPTTLAHNVKTPTLILHSDHDRRCPLAMGQMFYRILKENGCETDLVIYKDERHGMWQVKHQADVLERVLDWFARHSGEK